MQKRYPFKFLDAYTREDSEFFFGRQEEVEALYEMVFQTDLLLVYGASGTGKTSLIQCGLASKFQSHDWLPLFIRRGNNLNEALEKKLKEAGGSLETSDSSLDWLDQDLSSLSNTEAAPSPTHSPVAQRLRSIYRAHFRPIYLIFDQFEELYILGSKAEQQQFIETVKEILQVEQPVKAIISIREEYLGYLYEFEREVPELLRKKLRVEPMNLDKVKSVLKGVGETETSNVRLAEKEEEAIAEQIFQKIRGEDKAVGIQLPYLQVFLDKLYLQVSGYESREKQAVFTLSAVEQIKDIGDVLRDFLDEQANAISQELQADQREATPANIWKLLSPFATLEGTKEPIAREQLHARLPQLPPKLVNKVMDMLVARRILRYSETEELYEIAHDSLAKRIAEKRSDEEIALLEVRRLIKSQVNLKEEAREYFTEKQLGFIGPFLEQLALTPEEHNWIDRSLAYVAAEKEAESHRQKEELEATRKRLRTVRGLLAVAVLGLLTAGYFGWDANQRKTQAERAEQAALKQKNIADDAKRRSDTLRIRAEAALEEIRQKEKEIRQEKERTQEALTQAEQRERARLLEEQRRREAERKNLATRINDIETLIRVGDKAEARRLLQEALQIFPEHPKLVKLRERLE